MNPLTPAFRGVLLSAIIILIGVPITLLLVVYPQARKNQIGTTAIDRMTVFLVVSSLFAVSLSTIALTLLNGIGHWSLSETLPYRFLTTDFGRVSLVETSVGLVLGATTAAKTTGSSYISKRTWLKTVAGGGLVMLVTFCLVSYSPTIPESRFAIFLKVGHLTGVALWTGGVLVLAVTVPSLLTQATEGNVDELASTVIRRFSPVATVGVSLAGATGFAITAWHIPSPEALHSSRYGLALLGKLVLFGLAAMLGGLNRFLLLNRIKGDAGSQTGIFGEKLPDPFTFGIGRFSAVRNTTDLFVRMIRIELGVLIAVIVISVALQSILAVPEVTPLGYTRSSDLRRAFQLGAIGVAVIGIATIVYEIRERRAA